MSYPLLYSSLILLATIAASPHAVAQTPLQKPECSAALIDVTDKKVLAMKDGPQKTTATTEIAAARQTLSQGKIEECQDHLLKANLQTK